MTRYLIYAALLLPTALYVAWVLWARRRVKKGEAPPSLDGDPWFWLILAGFALMVAGLSYVAVTGGDEPGGTYYPPRYEDGKIIPGQVK